MIHKWSEEGRDEQFALFLRWFWILLGFVVCVLIVIGAQRMIAKARAGVQGTYSSQSGNEYIPTPETPLNNTPTITGSPALPDARAANAAFASGQPLGAAPMPRATYVAAAPPAQILPPAVISADAAFAVDSQRREAAASLLPLKELMQTIKEYDGKIVSDNFAVIGGSGPANLTSVVDEERVAGESSPAGAADAAQETRRRQASDRILNLADGMDGYIALYTHPDNFAPPLRDGVGEVARQLKTYLATLRNAVSFPERREELRAAASKQLAQAEQSLQALENLTGSPGVGSAAN